MSGSLRGEPFLLVQNWLPPSASSLSGPAWKLSAEAFFYCTSPFLLARTSAWSGSTLRTAFVLTCVAYSAARLANLPFPDVAILRLPDFFVGILTGHLYLRGALRNQERNATLLVVGSFALTLLVPQFFVLQSERFTG